MRISNIRPKPLSSEKRQIEILLHIKEKGTASIGEIAERFAVSEMTVRRILHKLSDARLIIRTPGGRHGRPLGVNGEGIS